VLAHLPRPDWNGDGQNSGTLQSSRPEHEIAMEYFVLIVLALMIALCIATLLSGNIKSRSS
jgi:hypothetical protein